MAYWSFRDSASPWADPALYTSTNIERVRTNIGDRSAIVHPVGGIGLNDDAGGGSEPIAVTDDLTEFVDAARSMDSIGWSIYDWMTISDEGQQIMSALARESVSAPQN